MIYFRFQISPLSTQIPDPNDMRTADFFFESWDAAQATQKAVVCLAQLGWKPITVHEAQEAFTFAEFEADPLLDMYFEDARREGMAIRINQNEIFPSAAENFQVVSDLGREAVSVVTEFPLPA